MDFAQVAEGTSGIIWGGGFYVFVLRTIRSEIAMRRIAEQNWRLNRWLDRRIRRGLISKDEWCQQYIQDQRFFARRVLPWFVLIFLLGSMITLIHGVDPHLWTVSKA